VSYPTRIHVQCVSDTGYTPFLAYPCNLGSQSLYEGFFSIPFLLPPLTYTMGSQVELLAVGQAMATAPPPPRACPCRIASHGREKREEREPAMTHLHVGPTCKEVKGCDFFFLNLLKLPFPKLRILVFSFSYNNF
jgi:hypothetical protein